MRILPVPLALDVGEIAAIRRGVAQRALALQAFFGDLAIGTASASAADGDVVERVAATEAGSLARLRRTWAGRAREEIRFVYGPDLARAPDGGWVVLEDNVGCVGGVADAFFVARAYARAAGMPEPDPASSDLGRAVDRWRVLLGGAVRHRLAATCGCGPGRPIRIDEDRRRAQLLGVAGVAVGSAADLAAAGAIANFESPRAWSGPALLNAPGTGLLGNKALLPFVDELIRQHCGEEPLLPSAETFVLRDDALPGADWVVKTATGSGGGGVHVLGACTADELAAVRAQIRAAGPCGTVAQRWVDCSTLPGEPSRIELRPVAYVLGAGEALVGRQLVGKAVAAGDRTALNNVSRGARYVAVLPVESGAAG